MFVLFEKKKRVPTKDDPSPSPVYEFQGCKLHVHPADEAREHKIYMPVADEVYKKFLIDPSMATRYVELVIEYEKHRKENQQELPVEETNVDAPIEKAPSFAPVSQILEPKTEAIGINFRLRPVIDSEQVDVLVVLKNNTLSRVEHDMTRVAPPVTIFGLNKDFSLEALFQTTLTRRNPTQTVQDSVLERSHLWIKNPRLGFTYGLKIET